MCHSPLKPGFHTRVSRTHNGAWCQWAPMITSDHSLRNKSLWPRNRFAHVELLRGLVRPVPLYAVTVTYRKQRHRTQKIFSVFRKKRAKLKTKNIMTTFGKSLFLTKHRMCYAMYMPSNTKYLAINQMMVAYGNRQNATAFAQANNSDLLQSLKHLMETRF